MESGKLYESLVYQIKSKIYRGTYSDQEALPPERQLALDFSVSRVTVRKAMELLEKEGIVERLQGSGNLVHLKKKGYKGSLDLIALVAPAQNPFFATFLDYFQQNAQRYDSLVLLKQKPKQERLEDELFLLYQKNIRNVVIWLDDLVLDVEYVKRLRGLGMNLVFLDITIDTPYADCVRTDNRDAIYRLYDYLSGQKRKVSYFGWDKDQLTSVREREQFFKEKCSDGELVHHLCWEQKKGLAEQMRSLLQEFEMGNARRPDSILCGDGEISILLKKVIVEQGIDDILIAGVDDYPESVELRMSVYRQNYESLAGTVYECLRKQNKNAQKWRANTYLVKGELIERE